MITEFASLVSLPLHCLPMTVPMAIDHLCRQCEALLRRHVRQADQSSVSNVMQVNQLSEVRIYCDQNSIFRVCKLQ